MYDSLLNTQTRKQWKRISLKRRSGVQVPLFSIYSKKSIGAGELPDLKLVVDWCVKSGMSIIQLLPMNDTGFNFRPYDAQSSFALDPVYLSIEHLEKIDLKPFEKDIKILRDHFPPGQNYVNYGVKAAKLQLLWKIFREAFKPPEPAFKTFAKKNGYWLKKYALFTVIKQTHGNTSWESWHEGLQNGIPRNLEEFEEKHTDEILFRMWIEWQLSEQFKKVKNYANQNGVLLMGDLPFLVSRDSADVWSHPDYFKLDLAAGAPPDAFIAKGQRWGMPPYQWNAIETDSFNYITERLRYAENFYDLFRIDHVVGIFRLWTIFISEPIENGGLNGTFDPTDKSLWENHGRKILSIMIENTKMLPCAEDLGVVPECSYKVLKDLGIVGMDVMRWKKNWDTDSGFTSPENYRENSIVVFSTHDMSSILGWWQYEAATVDEKLIERRSIEKGLLFEEIKNRLFNVSESKHGRLRWKENITLDEARGFEDFYKESYQEHEKFLKLIGLSGKSFNITEFVKAALETAAKSASIFNVQLLQDWLSLSDQFKVDPWEFRINFPGTISEKNWSRVIPFSLETIHQLGIEPVIQEINQISKRLL